VEIGVGRPVVGRRERPGRRALVVRRAGGPAAQLVHADIREDAVEPRGDGPARIVAAGARVAPEEGALDRVLGVGPGAEQPPRHRQELAAVTLSQVAERALVSLGHPLHQPPLGVHVMPSLQVYGRGRGTGGTRGRGLWLLRTTL